MMICILVLASCRQDTKHGPPQSAPFKITHLQPDSSELITPRAEARRVLQRVLADRFDSWLEQHGSSHEAASKDPLGYWLEIGRGTALIDPQGRFIDFTCQQSYSGSGSDLLTPQEAVEMTKRFVIATSPKGYTATDIDIDRVDDHAITIDFRIGLTANLAASAYARYTVNSVSFDRHSKSPTWLHCSWQRLPKLDPSTAESKIDARELDREAERVYRSVSPISGAHVTRGFVYTVPDFAKRRNEMTEEHLRMVKERRPTLLYEWAVIPAEGGWSQNIYVDARTGKGVSWNKFYIPTVSSLVGGASASYDEASESWQVTGQKGVGTLTPVSDEPVRGDATSCVLISASGRTVTAQYDSSTNLVLIGKKTYRASGAVLKALKRLPAPGTFGSTPRSNAGIR